MAKIYVASSWRNQYYSDVVDRLREAGHEVYDFRNPPQGTGGFHWSDVDPNYMEWSVDQYREGMKSSRAQQQFSNDIQAYLFRTIPVQHSGDTRSLFCE